ncbi:MAG: FkbM family methyltransferase [Bryobacteraceae bacterium]|jgi:FkbM family methyltransferase
MSDKAAEGSYSSKWRGDFGVPIDSRRATEDDIYYCYRLLLGRNPDAGGFANYAAMIDSRDVSIDLLVTMFLSSAEFKYRNPSSDEAAVRVDLPGFHIYALPDDWAVGQHILKTGAYEPHVTAVMREVLRPGMVFVDVGANIGFFTLLARSLVGRGGRVYAFEPNPRNTALLHLSLEANSFQDVELFPFALADSARLFVYDAQGSNGVITAFDGDLKTLASRMVIRSVNLDQLLQMDRCDVVKIDVEGAEGLAIRGAMRTIQAHHPMIFSEFSPPQLESVSRISGERYLGLLFAEGYFVSIITPSSGLVDCGRDAAKVMAAFHQAGVSHIDILAARRA